MGIRAVVVGGSLGGLSSALALRCVNFDVDVFERSRGTMKSRKFCIDRNDVLSKKKRQVIEGKSRVYYSR